MFTQFNEEEDVALEGLPYMAQILYLRCIRKHMDYKTGVTGKLRKISYQGLSEVLYIEPKPGRHTHGKPSLKQIRVCINQLVSEGLIEVISKERQLIFKCILATTDYQVFKKEGRGRAEEGQTRVDKPEVNDTNACNKEEGRGRADQPPLYQGIHHITYNNKEKDQEKSICTNSPQKVVKIKPELIVNIYHEKLPELAKVLKLNDIRKKKVIKLINTDLPTTESWEIYFEKISGSDFLMGRASNWCCDFEWIINSSNALKIAEGRYDNKIQEDDFSWMQ